MSFTEAEASDAALSGAAAALRAALEVPRYARNPHQVYDGMDSDPLISATTELGKPQCRAQLLRHIGPYLPNPTTIPDAVVSFCRTNLQQGPTFSDSSRPTFGRVQSLQSLVNAIASPSSGLSLRNAEALVRDSIAARGDLATKLARQRADFSGKHLSRYQMWSYPAGDRKNPFQEIGSSREDAVNILGLGYFVDAKPSAELIRWAHTVPTATQIRIPTAWDAASDKGNVYWRPGGKTYRLDVDKYALDEVVHEPIKGEDLTAIIEEIL